MKETSVRGFEFSLLARSKYILEFCNEHKFSPRGNTISLKTGINEVRSHRISSLEINQVGIKFGYESRKRTFFLRTRSKTDKICLNILRCVPLFRRDSRTQVHFAQCRLRGDTFWSIQAKQMCVTVSVCARVNVRHGFRHRIRDTDRVYKRNGGAC